VSQKYHSATAIGKAWYRPNATRKAATTDATIIV
jgi:hypothetical protein